MANYSQSAPYITIAREILAGGIVELEEAEGKLQVILSNDTYKEEFKAKDLAMVHRTSAFGTGGATLANSVMGASGTPEFKKPTFIPHLYYNWVDWDNVGDLLSANPSGHVVRIANDALNQIMVESNQTLSRYLYGNYGELAYIGTSSTPAAYSAGVMTFLAVGADVSANPHRFGQNYLKVGDYVDVIDETTLKPIAGASKIRIASTGLFSAAGSGNTVTATVENDFSASVAVGDFFVRHNDITSAGTPLNNFGLTAMAAAGNPNRSVELNTWFIGGLDAGTYDWWNPSYTAASSSVTTNRTYMRYAINGVQHYRSIVGGNVVMLANILSGAKLADSLEVANTYSFMNTTERIGGFSVVRWNFGDFGSQILFDVDTPLNRVYLFCPNAFHYCTIDPLSIQDTPQNMINFGLDKTRVTLRKIHATVAVDRRPFAMVYDLQ